MIANSIIAHLEEAIRRRAFARLRKLQGATDYIVQHHMRLAIIAICTAGDLAAGKYGRE